MSSVFFIHNVQSFIDRLRSRDRMLEALDVGPVVAPDARSAPAFLPPLPSQAEIRLRLDTVGAARRLASTKARHELI